MQNGCVKINEILFACDVKYYRLIETIRQLIFKNLGFASGPLSSDCKRNGRACYY